jgi:fimbrial chaperone protein
MRAIPAVLSTAFVLMSSIAPASAGSLQVSPVLVELTPPAAATTLNLSNPSAAPLKAQIRVMRWSLVNGQEHLELATDVVASPPMATVPPNADYTIRIVRTAKQAPQGEETYRLIVDEIPDPSARAPGTINMAFRYSIPVFFYPMSAITPALSWAVERRDGKIFVSATNTGTRHVRVSELQVSDTSGKKATIAKGLAGYVLARSSKSWVAPGDVQKAGLVGPLTVTAQGDVGPIHANAPEASR